MATRLPPVLPTGSATAMAARDEASHKKASRGQLRRLNLVLQVPPVVGAGIVLVAVDAQTWWGTAVLVLGLVTAVVAMERWAAEDLRRVAVPCLVVTAAVWLFGASVADLHTAFYGMTVVGSLVVPRLSGHRIAAAFGLVTFVGAVGAARLLVSSDTVPDVVFSYVVIPVGATALATVLMFGNEMYNDVMKETREREAELAVARERIRFAGDLHDIQGHTLHVVKLKATLAQKLVHSDVVRAEEELHEIHSLIADTITQTKALAHAQRRLNLSAELENAKNLFEAAGIRVWVDRETDIDTRTSELLGQVLRETTTNILRHAQATHVRITLGGSGITVVNDGAPDGPLPELSGLASLKDRVADDGGELTVEQHDGQFRTAAAFPGVGHRANDRATALEGRR
ncbi:two-component system, NarL family, sensor histidine kinase DesK [Promicromonospora umidemergens]|uniref:Signal transduction histidine kinase subgroup 3 dimerisation and phosphoacceptor domain-containing protein n=1 Tax=Promicromonospora umidemergens TaxID=629679 RepID=A0ABP8XLV4_9MICO|nr:histidine kinase [Promicromonospora umidemergens]MCP2282191.1 two-component system, NarL family, sensor histidine kinase DesK [Promicromonospora umidemergens]